MAIKKLSIEGLRGFSKKVDISFAVPDGKNYGSGLTVLVGPNNSGKSTVIEALYTYSNTGNGSNGLIPSSARNILNNSIIHLSVEDIHSDCYQIYTEGGAFFKRIKNDSEISFWGNPLNLFILSSKRGFSSTFGNGGPADRNSYNGNINGNNYRYENNINMNFGSRLLKCLNQRELFEKCLKKVIDPVPKWNIDSNDGSNLYLEFIFDEVKHSSNGAGDGYINIFNIVDALYDSNENNVIVIDEPEISLHPDLQKRLFQLLVEYSKDKQIIISTHSPYFIDWNLFATDSKLIRFRKEENVINIYELQDETKKKLLGILNDFHNPHILSLASNDICFLNDGVILTEGQEDVFFYPKIFKKYDFVPNASFFGWGAGGADKMSIISQILYDLGYRKVFSILDHDKEFLIQKNSENFPDYCFYAIKANDIRNKEKNSKAKHLIDFIKKLPAFNEKESILKEIDSTFYEKEGLVLDKKEFEINPKYSSDINDLIKKIRDYFGIVSTEEDSTSESIIEETKSQNQLYEIIHNYQGIQNIYQSIIDEHPELHYVGGSFGGPDSIEKIDESIYNAVFKFNIGFENDKNIDGTVIVQFNIDTNENCVLEENIVSNF